MQIPQFLKLFKRISRDTGWFCIAIGGHGAHFVRMKRTGTQVQVVMCTFHPMENVTSAALEKIVRELRLGAFQFTTLLAPDEYQILMVDAPNVPAEEMKTAIRYRIKDSLSYRVDDATVDVLQIPASKIAANRPQSLYAVAASNDTIQKCIGLFERAKINLSVIDIPEMAQRNLAELFEAPGRGLALLAFDGRGGLLTFTCDGELYLSRRVEITAGQLQDANESLRQQYFDRVELEVQRSLDYFDRQFHQISLNRLLVCAPEGVGLVNLLAENLGLPVEVLDLSQVMDVRAAPALLENEFLLEALPALGAALRQEKRAL
ncbi:MAG: MSHA bioproteinis protein [Gallionellaceae bacterium]|nr:MAG: MSHA bioproteinis protein [Gallionellaceae bacterium]